VIVASPLGLGMTPVIGALLVAAALLLTVLSGALDRRAGAAYQPA
jgi:predicted MFS family arabinose efflux permease